MEPDSDSPVGAFHEAFGNNYAFLSLGLVNVSTLASPIPFALAVVELQTQGDGVVFVFRDLWEDQESIKLACIALYILQPPHPSLKKSINK